MASGKNLNVEFLGFRKDIPHLMKSADIFVLPSKKEAFGLVILEAFVSKLPVIASNVGGIPEIIQNGEDGMIVEAENSQKLAYAINTLLRDKEMQMKFAENGYKKVKKKFDAKIMAKNTEKLYDEVSK